ncbi:ATP-grasp domain-containing protein [Salipiger sp. PrR003]|uniref:ATP-grasp domain-containing protein n=1 Tax=Salipiger sp. PrR003 TaxID=2706776 RepID=UPI0013DAE645|nr:ATP-grasp domain-containing protein [Salipiger sp. PrR003]NDV50640.1 ATP-grasp domain-containing protein [Salipiger sp. PrR003]
MHIVYQDAIVRGHPIEQLCADRGWQAHHLDPMHFQDATQEIERTLFKSVLGKGEPVVCLTAIRLAMQAPHLKLPTLQRGIIASKWKLTWSNYAAVLPNDVLLNPFGILFPWQHLKTKDAISCLRGSFGDKGVFIRPNSPWKPFAGFPTTWDGYEYNINSYESLESIEPGEICVVFPIKEISNIEWRFWVVAGKVVTWAPYSWRDMEPSAQRMPQGMLEQVERVIGRLEGYEDSLVIDMVETDDGIKLVELNGLSTAGFYEGMDVSALFNALPTMFGQPAL